MFFNNKFSGINFQDKKITFATVKMEKDLPLIQTITVKEIDGNPVESGRLLNKSKVSMVLRSFLEEKNSSKQVHLAIPTQHTLVRKITSLPDLEEAELGKILQFQLGDSILLPFDNPIYDFVKIGTIASVRNAQHAQELTMDELSNSIEDDLKGARSEILFFATSRELSEDLVDVCEESGLRPLSAEVRALALKRLINFVHSKWLTETEMIVEVSEESIDLHIFKDELIAFSRTMPVNSNQYFHQLQTAATTEEIEESLSLIKDEEPPLTLLEEEEIENPLYLKEEKKIAARVLPQSKKNTGNESVFEQEAYLNDLVNEVEKAQNFFRYTLGERQTEFTRIIVTGEYTDLIFNSFSDQMATEVCRIDFEPILDPSFIQRNLLDTCSVALGLAMRGREKANKRRKF
ncbi:pilus assembly protein PilM [Bacillus solitudinis]|uniref:pilus assembly protein PilM n=1 Tax=Bacillus solitudinis TaxID=2014074 RepID=UPI000C237018|nr:pilus assembly protein PilM [Bacillus solitudinis]